MYIATKIIRRDKEGHFIMIQGTIHQEESTALVLKIYVPNIGAPYFITQILLDVKAYRKYEPQYKNSGWFHYPTFISRHPSKIKQKLLS